MSSMAEVINAHCAEYESDGVEVYYECLCEEARWPLDGDWYGAHAEHVADALTKAGYGKLADAWDAGHESGFWNGRESAGNVEGLLIGVEHAREHNACHCGLLCRRLAVPSLRADAEAALEAAAPYLIRDARAAELEAAGFGFMGDFITGDYSSTPQQVGDFLRSRAAAIRAGVE